jgi:hypothetical protein
VENLRASAGCWIHQHGSQLTHLKNGRSLETYLAARLLQLLHHALELGRKAAVEGAAAAVQHLDLTGGLDD